MKRKVVKMCVALILTFVLVSIFNTAFATPGILDSISSINTGSGTTKVVSLGNIILRVVQVIGTAASLIMITICATQFMLAAPEGKAEYKKRLVPVVIGSIILFAATNILSLIQSTVESSIQ